MRFGPSRFVGRSLPSYREFLLVSDGAYADLLGATRVHAPGGRESAGSQTHVIGAGFLPSSNLRWLRDVNDWQADLYAADTADDADAPNETPVVDGEERWPWTPVADGLVIAVDRAPGTTCLVPVDGAQEWQVWDIDKEISGVFVSFRSMLEYQLEIRTPVPTIDEARGIIERARSGDLRATLRLAWIMAPEAVPLLAEIERGHHAALGLGRIGSDEAVETLSTRRSPAAEQALVIAGSDRAQDVLAAWGAVRALSASTVGALPSWPLACSGTAIRGWLRAGTGRSRCWGSRQTAATSMWLLAQQFGERELWDEVATAQALALLGAPEGPRATRPVRGGRRGRPAIGRVDPPAARRG